MFLSEKSINFSGTCSEFGLFENLPALLATEACLAGASAEFGSSRQDLTILVRAVGIEPTLCYQNQILSLARLPIPPRPHESSVPRRWDSTFTYKITVALATLARRDSTQSGKRLSHREELLSTSGLCAPHRLAERSGNLDQSVTPSLIEGLI
jgi:hypothetical protein